MCAWFLQRRLRRQCSTPACKDSHSPGSSSEINSFELMFSLSLPLPNSSPVPILQSEKLPSIQNSPGNGKLHTAVTPTETSEISLGQMSYVYMCLLGLTIQCVCAHVCVYTVAIAKKGPYSFPP